MGVLGYLKEWKDSVDKRPGTPKFTEAQKKLMMLSDATQEGIHITGTSTCIYYATIHARANERVI